MTSPFLEDFDHRDDFAKAAEVCPRTVSRYCHQPDGLPHLEFGGRLYIGPRSEAREWLLKRVKRPNPRR
jgi:hypothetical protein